MRANSEHQDTGTSLDKLKWLVILVLFIVIVWGNFYFSEPNSIYQANTVVRLIAVLALSALTLFLVSTTRKGKQSITFAKEARLELRKVVWPTRRETIQTTLLIAAITTAASLVLWGLDSITLKLISILTSIGF